MALNIHLSGKKRFLFYGTAVIAGVLLNGLFSMISQWLSLPYFLDSIFTVMISAVLGLWPGLFVGFLSNFFFEVLKGFPGYIYPFAIVNIFTALITWLHVKYGDFTKAPTALWMIISLSLGNAVLGAVIVYYVFDGITDEPIDSIIRAIVATGRTLFSSAFLGRVLINFVDKGFAVLLTFPLYRYFSNKKQLT